MANGKKKSKRAIYILSAFALLVVVVVVLVAATRGSTKIDPSKLAKVERGDLAKSVVATGKIEPITKVEVKSKASGIVQKLLVDYGEKVKKDQVLAELDKEEILVLGHKDICVAEFGNPKRDFVQFHFHFYERPFR